MSARPTLAEVQRRAIQSYLGDVFTAIVGRVETYDAARQTADLTPMVRRPLPTEDEDVTYEELPIIPNVPVLFPRGGGFSITWPIVPGNFLQLIVESLSISQWRRSGEISDSGDIRQNHLGSCVAIAGLGPNSDPIDSSQAGANALILEGPEIRLGKDATQHVALAEAMFTFIHDMISSGIPVANDGGAALQTAWKLYITNHTSPNPFAATKAKAK